MELPPRLDLVDTIRITANLSPKYNQAYVRIMWPNKIFYDVSIINK